MSKGGGWEWKSARGLSRWLADGEDHHLIRANNSGAWATSRARAGKTLGTSHAGDVAPVGPEAHERVIRFCELFYVECKAYKKEPNWWKMLLNTNGPVWRWWAEALEKAEAHGHRMPLLILKRNQRPPVVGHGFGCDFFPGHSFRVTAPEEGVVRVITFHLLEQVLLSDPIEVLTLAEEA